MAPNAQIFDVPIETIERNQFESNYGEGIETVQRHFNNFEQYLQARNIETSSDSIPYYDETIQIDNHIYHNQFNEQNSVRFSVDAADVIILAAANFNRHLHQIDNSNDTMPNLISIVDDPSININTTEYTEILVNMYLTTTNIKHIQGLVFYYRKLFPLIIDNLRKFLNNPYPYLDHAILNRQILEKLDAKSKKLKKVYVKSKQPKYPATDSSKKLKLVHVHIKRTHLQRKCKHSSR
jgi:hypothetical protein